MEQENSIINSRKYQPIGRNDRYTIESMYNAGCGTAEIAGIIGCSERSVRREIALGLVEQEHCWCENYWIYSQELAQIKRDEKAKNKGPYCKHQSCENGLNTRYIMHIHIQAGKEEATRM